MPRDFSGRMMKTDLFGRRISNRAIRQEVIAENRRKGRSGEEAVRIKYALNGYEVERTPRGKDFTMRKRDLMTGRVVETKHVEVKTGKSKLSRLQNRTKRLKGNYKVERVDPMFY